MDTNTLLKTIGEMLSEAAELETLLHSPTSSRGPDWQRLTQRFLAAQTREAQLDAVQTIRQAFCGGMGSYRDMGFIKPPTERLAVGYWVLNLGYAKFYLQLCDYLHEAQQRLADAKS